MVTSVHPAVAPDPVHCCSLITFPAHTGVQVQVMAIGMQVPLVHVLRVPEQMSVQVPPPQ